MLFLSRQYEGEALYIDLDQEIRVRVVDVIYPIHSQTEKAKVLDKR